MFYRWNNMRSRNAFTLVEMLTTITIVSVLLVLTSIGAQKVRQAARKTEELSAGRTLITAYLLASTENDGRFLPGYDRTVTEVELDTGRVIAGPAAARYPYRLLPYLNYQMEGSILLTSNKNQIDESNDYNVSLYPAFGINHLFVGGDVQSNGAVTYQTECIANIAQASTSPLVFATAGGDDPSGDRIAGFNQLQPPKLRAAMWNSAPWSRDSSPSSYGNLDARYGNKVIAVFLDGSVRQLSIDELRDMRLWNKNAAELNDPEYTIPVASSGGGRRR